MSKNNYDSSKIKVLKGLDAVRKRPGMYIGDLETTGLHHMIWEVLDNSIDEILAGFGDKLICTLHKDDSVTIQDFGRGIPVDIHPEEGISAATVVLTVLHAGGKFGEPDSEYKVSGGLHGVGISVVNALSTSLKITICKDGEMYEQEFKEGVPVYELRKIKGKPKQNGTTVWFKPDNTIFKTSDFQREIILKRLKFSSYLNKGVEIHFNDEKNELTDIFHSERGILDFIDEDPAKELFKPIYFSGEGEGEESDVSCEVAMTYKDIYTDNVKSFANNVLTIEGGTHEVGFQKALSYVFLKKIKELKLRGSDSFTSEDVREGLVCAISVKLPEAEFKGQVKGKLNNLEAQKVLYKITKQYLEIWVEENQKIFGKIVKKIETAKKAREASKRSREVARKDALTNVSVLPGKLTDCQSKDPSISELFLVEGDSAGGSCKTERDRATQAILPLKGKVLNVEKTKLDRVIKSESIQTIITALGCGFGKSFEIENLRYHKIILNMDADVDGSHIQFLLLLFFYKYYRPLIDAGYIYLSVPPLYRAKKKAGGEVVYYATRKEKERVFPVVTKEMRKEAETNLDIFNKIEEIEKKADKWIVSRFKGLGEMNPTQLFETTMAPKTRTLIKIKFTDDSPISAKDMFEYLGGKNKNVREMLLLNFAHKLD